MRRNDTSGKLFMMTSVALASMPLCVSQAHAAREHGRVHAAHEHETRTSHQANLREHVRHEDAHYDRERRGRHPVHFAERHASHGHHGRRLASRGGISCVPYAREVTGIEVTGNAADWWHNAAGVYARGNRPEVGSVLNFRANEHMHLGHVSAVTAVLDARHVSVDHANWWGPGGGYGRISHNITIVDVSPRNDWTEVRVELGHSGVYGSIYPTYGFIYARAQNSDRPAIVTAMATEKVMPVPAMNPAPRDLRPLRSYAERHHRSDAQMPEEVAEAPQHARRGLDLSMPFLSMDAPNRSLR